jgi:hypothetical protein
MRCILVTPPEAHCCDCRLSESSTPAQHLNYRLCQRLCEMFAPLQLDLPIFDRWRDEMILDIHMLRALALAPVLANSNGELIVAVDRKTHFHVQTQLREHATKPQNLLDGRCLLLQLGLAGGESDHSKLLPRPTNWIAIQLRNPTRNGLAIALVFRPVSVSESAHIH